MRNRWQDAVNLILGVWLFVSPWALQYTDVEVAAWNAYVLGAAIVVLSAIAVKMPHVWEEVLNMLLGLWLVLSPYIFGFASNTLVAVNVVAIGVLTIGFATWAMLKDATFNKWWQEHHFF